jgi:hypothetical protein
MVEAHLGKHKHPVSNPNSNHTKPTAKSSWILAITDFSTIRALQHYMDKLGIDAMFLRLVTFGHWSHKNHRLGMNLQFVCTFVVT